MAQPLYQLLRIKATYTPNGRQYWYVVGSDDPIVANSFTKLYTSANDKDFYRSGAYLHDVSGEYRIGISVIAFGTVFQSRIGIWKSRENDPDLGSYYGQSSLQYENESGICTTSQPAIYGRAETIYADSISYPDRYTFEVEYDVTGGGITTDNALAAYCQEQYTGASVKVNYSIPADTCTWAKLVYKKDKIPTSVTDGLSVDLNLNETEVTASGLDEVDGTRYYFVIFTDKSVSEAFPYDVAPVPL